MFPPETNASNRIGEHTGHISEANTRGRVGSRGGEICSTEDMEEDIRLIVLMLGIFGEILLFRNEDSFVMME